MKPCSLPELDARIRAVLRRGQPTQSANQIEHEGLVIDRADAKTLSANPLGVDRSGSTATVNFTVTYNGGKANQTFGLPMTLEGGSWKACPSVN